MSPARIVGYGVNGDPLHEGKLDLPELLEVPTPDEWTWARDFIARRRWQEAVTYREKAPHEYTVCQWVKADADLTHVPVIFLTGKDRNDDQGRSFKSGGDMFIKKPFSCERLLEIVNIVVMSTSKY